MKFIPILFSTAMVQANHDGRKNQTRRLNGLDMFNAEPSKYKYQGLHDFTPSIHLMKEVSGLKCEWEVDCPYGQVGDVLWVRESFAEVRNLHGARLWYVYKTGYRTNNGLHPWRPSIHMPATACRSWCIITGIECQRLQDITTEDAIGEGIAVVSVANQKQTYYRNYHSEKGYVSRPVNSYQTLWESINGLDSWDANPWVWVVHYQHTTTPPAGWEEYLQHIEISNLKQHINKDLKPFTPEFDAARQKLKELIDSSKRRAK